MLSDPPPESDARQKHSCGADSVHNPAKSYGSVKDHEGNSYKTIVIGNQEWMAENLRVASYANGDKITESSSNWGTVTEGRTTFPFGDQKYLCPFGRLYNWYAVTDSRQLCPAGWKIPDETDFTILGASAGSSPLAGLLSAGPSFWSNKNLLKEINNQTGFSGLPAGYLQGNVFMGQNFGSYLWSRTPAPFLGKLAELIFSYQFRFLSQNQGGYYAIYGASVRCLKSKELQLTTTAVSSITSNSAQSGGNITADGGSAITARGVCWSTSPNPTVGNNTNTNGGGTGNFTCFIFGLNPNTTYYVRAFATNSSGTYYGNQVSFKTSNSGGGGGSQTVTDIDGNVYQTVTIGTQVWMKENLKVSRYRNGSAIPTSLSDASWSSTTTGAYALYNNDFANNAIYGKLYNWYAVADPRGLCPAGWHVPSDAEWAILENYLGGSSVAGGKMKAISSLWNSPNSGATNSSEFTGLPGGFRNQFGSFGNIRTIGFWWSSSEANSIAAWLRALSYFDGISNRGGDDKTSGASVRCLRD